MNYSKNDALMTKGMAIICMITLHLFCRLGKDILGTPLIWLNNKIPLIFLFGFFSEICVPIYSICTGYAIELRIESNNDSYKNNLRRILKIMYNYWIVLILFSVLGLLVDPKGSVPGSLSNFIKSIFLLHSYNGAWWYLNTYVLLLLIPAKVLLFPIHKVSLEKGFAICLSVQIGTYFVSRFGYSINSLISFRTSEFLLNGFNNLIGVIPYVWIGACICRYKIVSKLYTYSLEKISDKNKRKIVIQAIFLGLFISMNIIHKAALLGFFSVAVFLLFNIYEKNHIEEAILMFLGRHSTNIWLTHMFFYLYVFKDLVIKARYPILIFSFMLVLCIITSYVIMAIQRAVSSIGNIFN